MIRGAIFDLDGVLLDSMGIWNDLGARYLRGQGITPEPGLNAILFAMSMEQGAAYLKAHYPLPQSEAEIGDGIARMVADYYFYEVPAKPGAAALLAFLAERNIPMAGTRPRCGSLPPRRFSGRRGNPRTPASPPGRYAARPPPGGRCPADAC